MNILINDQPTETHARNIAGLVKELGIEGDFALAVNGNFVPKSQYADTRLNPYDRIEIVAPMQGG